MPSRIARFFIVFLLLGVLVTACKPQAETPAQTPAVSEVTTAPVELLPTQPPAATDTPQPASRAVLVGVDTALEATLGELAAGSGWQFERRDALQVAEVDGGMRVVVFANAPANINEYTAAAPGTQFVVVSTTDVAPAANLNVIRVRPEHQAFMAGYISVISAADMRSAGLFPTDGPLGGAVSDAYVNGGEYFCGICNPYYAPLVRFPLTVALPAATDLATWQTAITEMANYIVYIVYVAPEIATPELLMDLNNRGFFLMGGRTPPAEVAPRWVVTIQADAAGPLRDMWAAVSAGQGGQSANASIRFSDANRGIFSVGKQALAERVVEELQGGFIDPYTRPVQ